MQMLDLSFHEQKMYFKDVSCAVESTTATTDGLGVYRLLDADWSGIVILTSAGKIRLEKGFIDYGGVGEDAIVRVIEKHRHKIAGLTSSLVINEDYGVMVLPIRKDPQYEVITLVYRKSPFDEHALEWMNAYSTVYYENVLLKNEIAQFSNIVKNIFDNTGIAIMNVDLDGNVVTANAAAVHLFGLGDDHVGKKIQRIRSIGRLWDEALLKAGNKEKYALQEFPFVDDARTRFLDLVFSPVTSYKEEVLGLMLTCSDETEKLLMEREISQLDQFAKLGEVAVGVAHDVRNPLMNIRCSAQFLKNHVRDASPEITGFLHDVLHETDRINKVVEQMLSSADMNRKGPYKFVDINAVVKQSLAVIRRYVGEKSIRLEMALDERIPFISGDKTELQQALFNILLNSLQAIPQKGVIAVSSELLADGKRICIAIEDTGVGVAEEIRDKLFNHFVSTKPNGVGFGLSIVKRVVNNHGGELKLASEPGRGTTMYLYLPCKTEKAKQPAGVTARDGARWA